jgi:mono/diheme cytochrome c family protein/glucose/arabinose dehydrogenase
MTRHGSRTALASAILAATLAVWSVPLIPQAQGQSAPGAPSTAAPPPGAQGPPGPGQRGGRGGRGGLGGPQENDPANATADYGPKPPVKVLTPAEEAKRFWLPPGFRMEPVLTDPDIEESAQIAFDGNGRMFVLELRGYMQDADATGELDPVGRISVHEDRDNDGKYERHSVFVDKLVFPRFVMPFGANAVLTMESNADEVWKYTDTNNDSVADKKDLFAAGFGRLANVEHQQSGLFWAMDNWLYSTVNAFRARWAPNGPVRQESTGGNGAQWGAAQDNYGKVWFQGGASGMPGYFQLPIHYGNFMVADQFEPNLNITWGAPVLIADMQGGLPSVRLPDGSLNRSTGAAGNDVFRGHRLPPDMVGDYFYGEAVARIVRRLHPVKTEGLTQLRNVYPLSEFIRSTDPLFRPVDMTTAPDGTLYITDMYRGIIQEAQWSGRGTYLRRKIEQYQLDKVFRHGRIWRLTYDGIERDKTQPRMLNETAAQLVEHLNHPNGWWRDTAQQLLVLKQDNSVVPALQRLAATRGANTQLARIHALWTLEGLGALDASFVREQMKDADPQIRIQAIRASETLYKAGDRSLAADYAAAAKDKDADVAIQAMLTTKLFALPDMQGIIASAQAANPARGVQEIGKQILNPSTNFGRGGGGRGGPPPFTADETATLERGDKVYKELCFSCHGPDGRGAQQDGGPAGATMAPALANSPRVQGHRDNVIKTLLHGMTGPLEGRTYPAGVMMPLGTNTDDWIAAIASYVRNSFGNRSPFVTAADVARVRAATTARKTMWTPEELEASQPRLLLAQPSWKLSASHNSAAASGALTFTTWNTGAPQQSGMWFQVELPDAVRLAEIQFESPRPGGRGGGRARGGAAATPPAGAGPAAAPGGGPPAGAPPGAAGGAVPPAEPGTGGQAAPPAFTPPPPASPRRYRVEVSMDGSTWSAAVAEGEGTGGSTVITFAPVRAKLVRITQTANADGAPFWSIQRLRLYEVSDGIGVSPK